MELLIKGIHNSEAQTFEVDNVRIINVLIPRSEKICLMYSSIARKIIKKCGIRPKIAFYPIPPEVAIKKEMIPYYFLCLARCREKKRKGISI